MLEYVFIGTSVLLYNFTFEEGDGDGGREIWLVQELFPQLVNKVEEFPVEKRFMIKTFPRPGPKLVSLYDQH